MTAETPGQAAAAEDDREALAADAQDIDGALAAELRELADWYESSARHSKGIRANEQLLCANRIRAALVRATSGRADAAREPESAAGLAMAETRKMRDVFCKLLDLFSMPDARRMRHASVFATTLERYAAEAGVKP